MIRSFSIGAAALVATAALAGAQHGPAVRPLGSVVATSTEAFGPAVALRHTSKGVLVNDGMNRRLVMLDAALANPTIIADTVPGSVNQYGRSAGLIAYKGDSSLFVDPQSMSMLVLDGAGAVSRVMALPRTRDAAVMGSVIGSPSYDGKGRLVYRGFPQLQFRGGPGGPGGGGPMQPPEQPDTTAIVRVDLETRTTDTVGYVKVPRPKVEMSRDEATGNMSVSMTMNPLPTIDEFAVLSDGSVALIRGRDYHIDFVRPDGKSESAAKMPFDWQRLTDEDKVAFIDSLKAARERFLAANPQAAQQNAPVSSSTTTTGPGGAQQTQRTVMIGGGGMPMGGGGNPMAGMVNNRNVNFVPANELPDYKPPFFSGAARADMDGNVWIQTIPTKAIAGGPVYDVINGKGELVDRVQVPKDRTVVGFGKGGVVYLAVRDGSKTKLERANLK